MKIRGNTVGTTMKRPDFNQTDPKKSDYIHNNPIPRVSEEDNGKVLCVQDGVWAAVEIEYPDIEIPVIPEEVEAYDGTVTVDKGETPSITSDYEVGHADGRKVGVDELNDAVEDAVADAIEEAKASGEFDCPKEVVNITTIDERYETVADLPKDKGNGTILLVLADQSLYTYNADKGAWEFKTKLATHTLYCVLTGENSGIYRYTMSTPYLTLAEQAAVSKANAYTDEQVQNLLDLGVDGKSAYEVALENGFEGTEEEWLASLKGEQGERGEQGKDGEDYVLTDDDKSEIASLVLSLIPNGDEVYY